MILYGDVIPGIAVKFSPRYVCRRLKPARLSLFKEAHADEQARGYDAADWARAATLLLPLSSLSKWVGRIYPAKSARRLARLITHDGRLISFLDAMINYRHRRYDIGFISFDLQKPSRRFDIYSSALVLRCELLFIHDAILREHFHAWRIDEGRRQLCIRLLITNKRYDSHARPTWSCYLPLPPRYLYASDIADIGHGARAIFALMIAAAIPLPEAMPSSLAALKALQWLPRYKLLPGLHLLPSSTNECFISAQSL